MARKHNDNVFKEKKITWSKGSLLYTGALFLSTVCLTFWLYISGQIQNMYDVSLLVAVNGTTGAIFGSNLVWYSKKSGAENLYKHRLTCYRETAKIRLEYNREMMVLMKTYGITQDQLSEIDMSGNMDEVMENEFNNMTTKLDETQNVFETEDTLETFTL